LKKEEKENKKKEREGKRGEMDAIAKRLRNLSNT
jgi:hypothetical protein